MIEKITSLVFGLFRKISPSAIMALLLILSLTIFGLGTYFSSSSGIIAKINHSENILQQELSNFSTDTSQNKNLIKSVYLGKIIRSERLAFNFLPSNLVLENTIKKDERFLENGIFSKAIFSRYLIGFKLFPETYYLKVADNLFLSNIKPISISPEKITDPNLNKISIALSSNRQISLVKIDSKSLIYSIAKPSRAELAALYDENILQFQKPESRTVSYIVVNEDWQNSRKVNNKNTTLLSTTSKSLAEKILFILSRKGLGGLQEVLSIHNGAVYQENIVADDLRKINTDLFLNLEKNEPNRPTDIVKIGDKFFIAIKESKNQSEKSALKQETSNPCRYIEKTKQEIWDKISAGDNMQYLAKQYGTTLEQKKFIINKAESEDKIETFAINAKINDFDIIDDQYGNNCSFIIAELSTINPAGPRPYEEVENELRQIFLEKKIDEEMEIILDEAKIKASSADKFVEFFKNQNHVQAIIPDLTLNLSGINVPDGFKEEDMALIFTSDNNSVLKIKTHNGYFIVLAKEVTITETENKALTSELDNYLSKQKSIDFSKLYGRYLMKKYPIKLNKEYLNLSFEEL